MAEDAAATQEPAVVNQAPEYRTNNDNVEGGTAAGREQATETAQAPDNAAKKPRKRRTNEEISLTEI
jgi:hypothetical protein